MLHESNLRKVVIRKAVREIEFLAHDQDVKSEVGAEYFQARGVLPVISFCSLSRFANF